MKKLSKITESIWSDIQDRSMGKTVKKEDGMIIGQLEDGTKLIMSNEAWADGGELVDFGGSNIYTFNESGDNCYIAVIKIKFRNGNIYENRYKYFQGSRRGGFHTAKRTDEKAYNLQNRRSMRCYACTGKR